MRQNRFGGSRFERPTAPVREGEELDVKIEAVGEKGDGIAKKDGFVLFVPNVKEGDEVRIRVNKVLRKVGFAEVIGQPQGPIETTQAPAQEEESEMDKIAATAATMEDTEDFGEEETEQQEEQDTSEEQQEETETTTEEEPQEEQPEETPTEEEPQEETETPLEEPTEPTQEEDEKKED